MRNLVNIQSTGRYVGGNQNFACAGFELGQCLITLALGLVAM
jgi:hypothetical protein